MARWGEVQPTYDSRPAVQPVEVESEVTTKVIDLADSMISGLQTQIKKLSLELSQERQRNANLVDEANKYKFRNNELMARNKDLEYKLESQHVPVASNTGTTASYNPDGYNYDAPLFTSASCGSTDTESDNDTVNPMECLIIFLQDNDILDLFVQCVTDSGTSFEELAESISPSEYIAYGTTGTSYEVKSGWGSVDEKWQNVVNNLQLNDLEAWYE